MALRGQKIGRGQHLQTNWQLRMGMAQQEADVRAAREALRGAFVRAVAFVRARAVPNQGNQTSMNMYREPGTESGKSDFHSSAPGVSHG